MRCEVCENEEAAFTIIPTGEGLPQSLGPACFARSGLELAKAILPAEEIAATLGPLFVTPTRAEAIGKGSKRGKAKPERSELDRLIESGQQVDDGDEGPLSEIPAQEPKPEPPPGEPEEPAAAENA